MAKKQKGKKRLLVAEHPATIFLNACFYGNIKALYPNTENLYEKLEELHQAGKSQRSPLNYLTYSELWDFFEKENPKVFSQLPREVIIGAIHTFSVVLGWKQFKQIYHFHPSFLQELLNIDMSGGKYHTISVEEVLNLPCYNFYIEQDFDIGGKPFVGCFVYFDKVEINDQPNQIKALFIADPNNLPQTSLGLPAVLDYYSITLAYEFEFVDLYSIKTGETIQIKPEAKDLLKIFNPNVFEHLGEDAALKLISTITQMITYLSAINVDLSRAKKPTTKPDIKRHKVKFSECEVWNVGETYVGIEKKIISRYANTQNHAYNRDRVIAPKEDEQVPSEEVKEVWVRERKKGYHVRPHMRRAHYAYYWYGKKDGSEERVRRRKYIAAVFINNTDEEIEVPTREIIQYRF